MLSLLYCLRHNKLRKQHFPWDSVSLPFLFPFLHVPYLQIVRSAGLGSIMPNTTTRLLCRKPCPVPFKPPFTIRLYLSRSNKDPRSNSLQTHPIAAIRAHLSACTRTNKKRTPVRHPLSILLCCDVTNIHRYLTPILQLRADCLSRTPLT